MRTSVIAALVASAVLVALPASAADLGWRPGVYARVIERAEPLVIYDFEPGIAIRAYWRSPWQGRRYFPATGSKPEIGRDEDVTNDRPKAPADFFRSWSTSSLITRALTGAEPAHEHFGPVPQK